MRITTPRLTLLFAAIAVGCGQGPEEGPRTAPEPAPSTVAAERPSESGGPSRESSGAMAAAGRGPGTDDEAPRSPGRVPADVDVAASSAEATPTGPAPSESVSPAPSGAGASPSPARAGLRLVVDASHAPRLASEERQRSALIARLERSGWTVDAAEPTPAERAFLRGEGTRPPAWSAHRAILVLGLAAPRELRSGRRQSRGLARQALYGSARVDPLVSFEGEGEFAVVFEASNVLAWAGPVLGAMEAGR